MQYNVYKDTAGEWRWNLTDTSNRIVATSAESFLAKADCLRAIELIRDHSASRVSESQSERQSSTASSKPKRALSVFLCHSSGDKPAVRALYHRLLVAAGYISPWLDEEDLLPGQRWEDEIPAAVRHSDVVLVCLSNESINRSGYVQKEIGVALDVADRQPEGTIFLIPVKLEECQTPNRLSHLHYVNLFEDKGFERLIRALTSRAEKLGIGESTGLKRLGRPDKQVRKTTSEEVADVVIHSEGELKIRERHVGNRTILDMNGKVTIGAGCIILRNGIHRLLQEGKKEIILNLAGVDYIDSAGIGELVSTHTYINRNGGRLKLLKMPRRIKELMVITKLYSVFYTFEDETDALNSSR